MNVTGVAPLGSLSYAERQSAKLGKFACQPEYQALHSDKSGYSGAAEMKAI